MLRSEQDQWTFFGMLMAPLISAVCAFSSSNIHPRNEIHNTAPTPKENHFGGALGIMRIANPPTDNGDESGANHMKTNTGTFTENFTFAKATTSAK